MQDTKTLVSIFLRKLFHNRLHVIDTTYQFIDDYNKSKRTKLDYHKTLKNICSQIGKEIPNQVLVYLLTLVEMPMDLMEVESADDSQVKPLIETIKTLAEIQRTDSCLTDILAGCITKKNDKLENSKIDDKKNKCDDKQSEERNASNIKEEKTNAIPATSTRTKRNRMLKNRNKENFTESNAEVRSLLELTAAIIFQHHNELKLTYQRKFNDVWALINSNQMNNRSLETCYTIIRDLNKKRKLLRDIENDHITNDGLADLYQDVDIFLKEHHVYDIINQDIFKIVDEKFDDVIKQHV